MKTRKARKIGPPDPMEVLSTKLSVLAANLEGGFDSVRSDLVDIKNRVTRIEVGDRVEAQSETPSFRELAKEALLGQGYISTTAADHFNATGRVAGADLKAAYPKSPSPSVGTDHSAFLASIERLARENGRLQEKIVAASVQHQHNWDSVRSGFEDLKMAVAGLSSSKKR